MADRNTFSVDIDEMQFESVTDSLLASLTIDQDIPLFALDKMFAVLRNPSFNMAEASMRSSEDVFNRVAEIRQRAADARSTNASIPASFPKLVLDLVIDFIADERDAALATFRDSKHDRSWFHVPTDGEYSLQSMALVCRAWSWPAQRALGRTLCLNDPCVRTVKKGLSNPIYGPWTHQILIFEPAEDDWEDDEELGDLMVRLLARVRSVRSFGLIAAVYQTYMSAAVRAIKELALVRELHVRIGGVSYDSFLGLVCEAVGHLPILQCLAVEHSTYAFHQRREELEAQLQILVRLEQLRPPRSLASLSLTIGKAFERAVQFVAWLSQ